jgi:hypothetical protein
VKLLLRQALPLWRLDLLHHGLVMLSTDTSGTWLQLSIWCNAPNRNAPNRNARVAATAPIWATPGSPRSTWLVVPAGLVEAGLAAAADPHRHQHRLHQSTPSVVVVGVGGEPEGQAEQGKNAREENEFGHGILIGSPNRSQVGKGVV